jgi:type I restriction enzyme R subunit
MEKVHGNRSRRTGANACRRTVRADRKTAARLPFNQVLNDKLQDMVDSNFRFYKQITDNPDFTEDFLSWMFERYVRVKRPNYKA